MPTDWETWERELCHRDAPPERVPKGLATAWMTAITFATVFWVFAVWVILVGVR